MTLGINSNIYGNIPPWFNFSGLGNSIDASKLNFFQPLDFGGQSNFFNNFPLPFFGNTYENKVSGCGMYVVDSKKLESQYSPLIEKIAEEYKVDPKVIKAMVRQESSFNPNAVSKCGAKGLMQLMPGTAKDMGVQNVFDPEQNIRGGVKYLASLLKRYNGDYRKAVAAYNGGMGNIDKKGINFCSETSNYHRKILGDYYA